MMSYLMVSAAGRGPEASTVTTLSVTLPLQMEVMFRIPLVVVSMTAEMMSPEMFTLVTSSLPSTIVFPGVKVFVR